MFAQHTIYFATVKYEHKMKKKMIRNPSRSNQILKKFPHLPKKPFERESEEGIWDSLHSYFKIDFFLCIYLFLIIIWC